MTGWTTTYLGLGSNQKNPAAQLHSAIRALREIPASRLESVSSLYKSKPVGPQDQPDFLNAVARLDTGLEPHKLLEAVQAIEERHGRKRTRRWGPRTLDIDILLYGDAVIDTPSLTVPHPEMTRRAFVLIPLSELAPQLKMPTGERIDHLRSAIRCDDVSLYEDHD